MRKLFFSIVWVLLLSGAAYAAQLKDTIVTGNLSVEGDQDEIQVKIKGNATQTNFLMTLEQNDGTDKVTISNSGDTTVTGILTLVSSVIISGDTIDDFANQSGLADGDSTTTQSDSGLEVISNSLTLLRGCADNEILKWDETQDDWNCEADGGGGSDTNAIKMYYWPMVATLPLQPIANLATGASDGVAPIAKDTDTNLEILAIAFDDTGDEFRAVTFKVPEDVTLAGNVTITLSGYAATAAAQDVAIIIAHYAVADAENWDGNVTEEALTTTLTNTQDAKDDIVKSDESSTSLGWAAGDTVYMFVGRDGDHATDDGLSGDFNATDFSVEIPRG